MKRLLTPLLALALLVALTGLPSCRRSAGQAAEPQNDSIPPLGFRTDSFDVAEGKIVSGETFSRLLTGLGAPTLTANRLAIACDSVFDVRRMRAGNHYQAYYRIDTAAPLQDLKYLVYQESRISSVVFDLDSVRAWRFTKPVETVGKCADVTISSSLWNDMLREGVSPLLILDLSDIYAWTIDFFGLQEGDRFKVMYTQRECEGEVIDIDTVYYAEFIHAGKEYPAIMFDQRDGGNRYWNEKGESLRKAFLKAPLQYSRISSGFSYHRMHPVHHTVRAHTGVDYAAPTGTPVHTIGDGTVISVGWGGGGGNTVKIRHNSVYTTAYLHLSRFAKGLKAGQRVRQGDVIGYVGMTGTATGPHLDFRVWKNGTPINPLKMESPAADPLKEEFRAAFDSTAAAYKARLEHLLDLQTHE